MLVGSFYNSKVAERLLGRPPTFNEILEVLEAKFYALGGDKQVCFGDMEIATKFLNQLAPLFLEFRMLESQGVRFLGFYPIENFEQEMEDYGVLFITDLESDIPEEYEGFIFSEEAFEDSYEIRKHLWYVKPGKWMQMIWRLS